MHKQRQPLRDTGYLPCASKARFAHGKRFAVCSTQQKPHGNQASANDFFAVGFFCWTHGKIFAVGKDFAVGFFYWTHGKIFAVGKM